MMTAMLRLGPTLSKWEKCVWAFEWFAASFLGFFGSFWALLLLLNFVIPPQGFIVNLIFVPGWLVYFGWWSIILRNKLPIRRSWFWLVSAIWNLGLISLALRGIISDVVSKKNVGPPNCLEIWLVLAGGISLVCAFLTKRTQPETR